MRRVVVVLVLACGLPSHAHGWGQEGHAIVAEIAQRRLDVGTLKKIEALLKTEARDVDEPQVALSSIASWADDYRAEHEETTNWHFADIPFERSTYDPAVDCKADPKLGDCIINAIDRQRQLLADCTKPAEERTAALKFLVHFVGDVHQPLHAADRKDHGGNDVQVTFFGQAMKLHAVWDTGLIMHAVYAWGTYVARLEHGWLHGRDVSGLVVGTPIDWAVEAHQHAQRIAYDIPDDGILGLAYYEKSLPVVDRQLALAGLRLARMLKETLQPTASCP